MHCPRCGTVNEEGDRFCSSCGTQLGNSSSSSSTDAPVPPGKRLGDLIGKTPRARLITVGTIVALIVAVVAFIALKPAAEEETIPYDAYTKKADELCLTSKAAIVALERQYGQEISLMAREMVPVIGSWRTQMSALTPPADRVELARQLEAALVGIEAQIGGLARVAKSDGQQQTIAKAKDADAASSAVEEAVSALGLAHCAEATIGFSATKR